MAVTSKNELFSKMFIFFLNYLGGILKSYIFVITFGLIMVMILGTDYERLFVRILGVTPGIGLGKSGNFSVDHNSIILFFFVWGAIFALITETINKITKVRIYIGKREYILFGIVLHSISFLVFSFRFGFSFATVFIGLVFTTFLLSGFFLSVINLYRESLNL